MKNSSKRIFTALTFIALSTTLFTSKVNAETRYTTTVKLNPMYKLCPRHIRGDREFAGNGPSVNARAYLFTTNRGKDLKVRLYLRAKETKRNWTTAEKTWTFPIWSAPLGKKIIGWTPKGTSRASYIDQNHQLDTPSVTGSNLVRRFEINGDTRGNDVGNCTRDDVYMNVYFQPIRVTYK